MGNKTIKDNTGNNFAVNLFQSKEDTRTYTLIHLKHYEAPWRRRPDREMPRLSEKCPFGSTAASLETLNANANFKEVMFDACIHKWLQGEYFEAFYPGKVLLLCILNKSRSDCA